MPQQQKIFRACRTSWRLNSWHRYGMWWREMVRQTWTTMDMRQRDLFSWKWPPALDSTQYTMCSRAGFTNVGLFSIQIWVQGPSSYFLSFTFCCLEACSFTSDAMDSACTETGQKNEKNWFSECAALNVCGALRPNNANTLNLVLLSSTETISAEGQIKSNRTLTKLNWPQLNTM